MMNQREDKRIPFSDIAKGLDQAVASADPIRTAGLRRLARVRAVKETQLTRERARLSEKLGAQHPQVAAIGARLEVNRDIRRDLTIGIQRAETSTPKEDENIPRLLALRHPPMWGYDVEAVQSALRDQHFDPGLVDGIFGSRTEDAVRRFQTTHGLESDGVVGPITRRALGLTEMPPTPATFPRILELREKQLWGDDVKAVQEALKALGDEFDPGELDGIFGSQTEDAVKKFQRAHGLEVNGIVDRDVRRALGLRE